MTAHKARGAHVPNHTLTKAAEAADVAFDVGDVGGGSNTEIFLKVTPLYEDIPPAYIGVTFDAS